MIKPTGSGLLAALTHDQIAQLEPHSREVSLEIDEILFRADESADDFYVVTLGLITLELEVAAGPSMVVGSVGEGDLLGLSWLFPPFVWKWTARATAPSELLAFDAAGVRDLMEEDHDLGYRITRSVAAQMKSRLTGVRLQLMDLYGSRR